jgi:hypothetical protein
MIMVYWKANTILWARRSTHIRVASTSPPQDSLRVWTMMEADRWVLQLLNDKSDWSGFQLGTGVCVLQQESCKERLGGHVFCMNARKEEEKEIKEKKKKMRNGLCAWEMVPKLSSWSFWKGKAWARAFHEARATYWVSDVCAYRLNSMCICSQREFDHPRVKTLNIKAFVFKQKQSALYCV